MSAEITVRSFGGAIFAFANRARSIYSILINFAFEASQCPWAVTSQCAIDVNQVEELLPTDTS